MIKKLFSLLIVLLMIFAGGYFLLATQRGLNWTYQTVKIFIPGELNVTNLSGSVFGPIKANKIEYSNTKLFLEINNFAFNWKPLLLLAGKLRIQQLEAQSVTVELEPGKESEKPSSSLTKAKLVSLLKRLQLRGVSVSNIVVKTPENPDLVIPKFTLSTAYANGQINSQFNLLLRSIDSFFNVHGTVAKNWDIAWQLKSPKLSNFLLGIEGELDSKGTITGKRSNPLLKGTLVANNLSYQNKTVDTLSVSANLHFASSVTSDLKLVAQGLSLGLYHIDKLSLEGKGNRVTQNIEAKVIQEQQTLDLKATGKFDKTNWKGQFNTINIRLPKVGLWELEKSVPVAISATRAQLQNLCLIRQMNKICLKAQWQSPDKISIDTQAKSNSLELLDAFLPYIKNSKGDLLANLTLKGTFAKPRIDGKLTLKDGSTFIPYLGVAINDISLNAQGGNSGIIKYSAEGIAGAGKLKLTGSTNLFNKLFTTEIQSTADNIHAYKSIQADIYASTPNFYFFADKNKLEIKGKVIVPQASLTPHDFSDTVTLPDNVVFVGKEDNSDNTPFNFFANISLVLGNKVIIKADGLSADLTGELTIIDKPNQPTTANGQLRVINGTYKAYGQELSIEDGRLLFAGGAIENPGLLIRAQRTMQVILESGILKGQVQNIIVGVNVTGTLKQPKLSLFSIPATLTQQEILSYLLFGQSIGGLTQNQGQSLTQAASALNLGLNEFVGLKKTTGLDQINFDTEPVYDPATKQYVQNTSLVLGKYLTSKLFLNYRIGISEPINILRLRYNINEKWSVQGETSGDNSGVDFLYSIEK